MRLLPALLVLAVAVPASAQPHGKLHGNNFYVNCKFSHTADDDPIVFPGQSGKSHLHMFIGNTGANANSTYQSLRTTGGSTCDNQGQSFAINRSSYWTPAMMDGAGDAVLPDYVLVYYKRFPVSGPGCVGPMAVGICTDLPNGLRFIFGYNMTTMTGGPAGEGTRDYWSMDYNCWSNEANTVPIPAAAQANFHMSAAQLSPAQAARLAAIIPKPLAWKAARPGPYIQKRGGHIAAGRSTPCRHCPGSRARSRRRS